MGIPHRYVVDASVGVKWFAPEEKGSKKARFLLKEIRTRKAQVFVPAIFFYEVANALARGKKFSPSQVNEALFALYETELQVLDLDPGRIERSTYLMGKYNLTFYDAVYGAIAWEIQGPLYSADTKSHIKIEEITTQIV